MHRGWIKLYRCLLDDPVWQCSTPPQKVILVTLLLMANHTERKWQWQGHPYICRPGQFITSLKSIAENAGKEMTRQNIRTALKRLEKMGFLTMQSTTQHTLITICSWEIYQANETFANPATNHQPTIASPTPNQRLTPNKNVKNEKHEKKGPPSRPVPLSFEQQDIQRAQTANAGALSAFMEG